MLKQKINRHTWLRGEGSGPSFLLRPSDQKRCCLGQFLGDQGVPDTVLLDMKGPVELIGQCKIPGPAQFLVTPEKWNSEIGGELMTTNDSQELSGSDRESYLKEYFAKGGVEVEFYNPTIILPRAELQQTVSSAVSRILNGYSGANGLVEDIANVLRKHDLDVVITD